MHITPTMHFLFPPCVNVLHPHHFSCFSGHGGRVADNNGEWPWNVRHVFKAYTSIFLTKIQNINRTLIIHLCY